MQIRTGISSPPDRDSLVADLLVDEVQLAELRREGKQLIVELYPRPDGAPWVLPYEELIASLVQALARLEPQATDS